MPWEHVIRPRCDRSGMKKLSSRNDGEEITRTGTTECIVSGLAVGVSVAR